MSERFFSKDHVWVEKRNGTVRAGLTEFACEELGEIVFIELPARGKSVVQGDVVCSLDSLKSSSEIYAPLSGKIVAVNAALESDKTLQIVNTDPEGEGWLFELELSAAEELSGLMSESQYRVFISA